jgi:hypothetical protein
MSLLPTSSPAHFRDEETKAVICTDILAWQNYKANRSLNKELEDIKNLMKEMLNARK